MKQRLKLIITTSILATLVLYPVAKAVPPPDFIFAAGAQITQIFAIVAIFLSAAFSMFYSYIKAKMILIKNHKPSFVTISLIGIALISIGIAYSYDAYQQNKAYEEWLVESESYTQLSEERDQYLSTSDETDISLLDIGAEPGAEEVNSDAAFISNIEDLSADSGFIEDYYRALAEGDLDHAYELSKQSVSLETFKGWYSDTTKITLDDMTKIDDETSSLELTLYESSSYTRYGVLITLKYENNEPVQIGSSTVKILSEGTLEEKGDTLVATSSSSSSDFYTANEDTAYSISNVEFQALLDSGRDDYIVLDARENLEYENGYFPESTHIRYADLQAGKWIEIPEDKFVYVICWSGIRGSEVAEFLRTKEIVAMYLEGGASEWVAAGGVWSGNIDFGQKYTEDRYTIVYSTDEVYDYVDDGVVLVDCREPWEYNEWHIDGSFNIPLMYTPSADVEDAFAQVPEGSTVITVCDGYVNCFDAKITGVELDSRGYTFIGRYNKPWEY